MHNTFPGNLKLFLKKIIHYEIFFLFDKNDNIKEFIHILKF